MTRPSRAASRACIILLSCSAFAGAALPQSRAHAETHAARGWALLKQRNFPAAEAEFREAVDAEPENSAYLGSLGAVLGMEHRLKESDVYLKKALALNPADHASRRNLASNEFQSGELIAARTNLEELLKTDPSDRTAILLLGMVDEELKLFPAAMRLLSSVPEEVRQRPESVAALAQAYYSLGRKADARATLNLLSNPPAPPAGTFLGGEIAARARDFPTAERLFESIWSSYPDTAKLGYNLAAAQYNNGQIASSQQTLLRLITAGHDPARVDGLLALCYEKQKKFKLAIAALDKALQKDPNKESNYLDAGRILLEAHRPNGALAAAGQALKVDRNSAQAYRLEGQTDAELFRPVDAGRAYAQAVKLDPSDKDALLGLALAQEDDGKIAAAERTFKVGIRKFPHDAVLYQEYGKMLLTFRSGARRANEARAVSLLSTALSLNSRLPEPYYELGNLALQNGHLAAALRQLQTAEKLSPANSEIHYALAQAYRRLGRREDAMRELTTFRALNAKGPEGRTAPPAGRPGN
jgi:tetratricopeptide (TPR) repeat protein